MNTITTTLTINTGWSLNRLISLY